jgi:membrane associated rhomboid family serine protease
MIPIRADYRMTRTPWVNYVIVGINVALYLVGLNGASEAGLRRVNQLLLHPDNPQLYQFFSCIFLHGGFMHLAGNMVFLWVFGNGVNDRFGHGGYLAFYLSGGVLAGIGYLLLSGHAPVLGASGAISAVTGAYLVLLPRVRVTLLNIIYIITTFEVSSLYFLLFQFVFNLYMSLEPKFSGLSESGVAYWAHSSGYVFGIGVTAALLATRLLPRDALDLLNLIHSARRRGQYRRMVASGFDPFKFTSPPGAGAKGKWVEVKAQAAEPQTPQGREAQLRGEIGEIWQRHDLSAVAEKYLQLVQVAEDAVLPQAQQLDVANQLMAEERYPAAADAYERFIKHYGNYEHISDIYLMLGLLYSRYLHQYDQAEHYLQRAIERLGDEKKLQMAKADLQALRQRR